MRVLAAGCEYSGVSTLLTGLMDWGHERNIHFHHDDHFSVPDHLHLEPEDQRAMVAMSPTLKERFQRMQMGYHFGVLRRHQDCLFSGFHIEEAVYGDRYYYPGVPTANPMACEPDIEPDTILVHLHARPEVIRERMAADPHEYNLIRQEDIPQLQKEFAHYCGHSSLVHKVNIDTSDLTAAKLLKTFFEQAKPHLPVRDLLLMMD
jgi:hypothetical protein